MQLGMRKPLRKANVNMRKPFLMDLVDRRRRSRWRSNIQSEQRQIEAHHHSVRDRRRTDDSRCLCGMRRRLTSISKSLSKRQLKILKEPDCVVGGCRLIAETALKPVWARLCAVWPTQNPAAPQMREATDFIPTVFRCLYRRTHGPAERHPEIRPQSGMCFGRFLVVAWS